MQGTPHNVENIPQEKDDEHPSNGTEKGGGAAGAPETPTGPSSEGKHGTESENDEEGSES
jgi:hypothetical protein